MSLIFRGSYKKLVKYAGRVDADGGWRELRYGGKQYRTKRGAVLNWWCRSGKILFQGQDPAKRDFEQAFRCLAANRLTVEERRPPRMKTNSDNAVHAMAAALLKDRKLRKAVAAAILRGAGG